MRRILFIISSVLFSLLMLVSTIGMSYSVHYCKISHTSSIQLFQSSATCHSQHCCEKPGHYLEHKTSSCSHEKEEHWSLEAKHTCCFTSLKYIEPALENVTFGAQQEEVAPVVIDLLLHKELSSIQSIKHNGDNKFFIGFLDDLPAQNRTVLLCQFIC